MPSIDGSTSLSVGSINNNGNAISYTYDSSGNIETITENGNTTEYYYNELNELVREDNAALNQTITYSYDVGGNILKKFIYPFTTGELGTPTSTINYTYSSTWKDQMASYDGKAITYDAIGNPLTYDGYSFTWEAGRQLSSINKTGLSMSFKYNDDGIRTQKTVNGVTTTYHVVGDKVTYETNGTDEIYYSYDSENNLVSIKFNGVEYYYIRNAQGDIIGLVDGNGAQVVSYSYDSWGKLIRIDGTLKDSLGKKNPYRYRGYRYDEETGLYYLNSRYYNPEWGRFLNADGIAGGIGAVLTQNAYAYCQNQPINHKDPSGYIWETALDIGSIGWSAYDLVTKPSWRNAAYLAWDVGAAAIPFVPGSYVARAGKIAKTVAKRAGNALKSVRIINKKYAGKIFKLSGNIAKKYPNGVRFSKKGFPDFGPYAKMRVKIKGLTGKSSDFTKANKAVGLKSTPKGYTWHHVEDGMTMMLVPSDLHRAVRHTGGASLLKKGLVP